MKKFFKQYYLHIIVATLILVVAAFDFIALPMLTREKEIISYIGDISVVAIDRNSLDYIVEDFQGNLYKVENENIQYVPTLTPTDALELYKVEYKSVIPSPLHKKDKYILVVPKLITIEEYNPFTFVE